MSRNRLSLPAAEVRRSAIHGDGVFATRELEAGTLIGIYAGRRYAAHEIDAHSWDDRVTYLFGLSDGSLIDGAQGGNATRHLNHACEPNCESVEEFDADGELVVLIKTITAVSAGAELFLDYALNVDDTAVPSDYPCRCGAASCRGTLVALDS